MERIAEFIAGFACPEPEYLPEALKIRLDFLSCLSHKQHRDIYLVQDCESGGQAILKITGPESADSVRREYELLSKLNHPSIPKALFYCEDQAGREYLIREYIPGDTLDYLLERDGVFDARTTLGLTEKLCAILAYLHSQTPPIIYRDLKPQNIVITANGKISLIDFGISREDNREKSFDTVYVGSTAFAAPELYGFTRSDSRTDIFAMGRLMLYLNTGSAIQQEALDKVESKALLKLIKKCTQLSPEKRFPTVDRLSRAIGRTLRPPAAGEIAVCIGAAALCVIIGLSVWNRWNGAESGSAESPPPVGAGGTGYEQEVKLPVLIQVLFDGKPYSDCAVAVDNHYWYQPAENGKAQLYAYAFDDYKIRAVSGNRTAFELSAVTRDTGPLSFTFDLAKTPLAAEYTSLSLPCGQSHQVLLDISGAENLTLSEAREGVSVEKRGNAFYLLASKDVAPGHYYLYAEAANNYGTAYTVISLLITEEKPVTVITTAQGLEEIRQNLSGHYALGADIDLSGIDSWTPIGDSITPFAGEFDGMGYTITGLCIQGEQGLKYNESGLFGAVSNGVVRNVIIRESDIYTAASSGTGFHGFVVGKNIGGLIEHCAVFDSSLTADIGLESGAGSICGGNQGIIRGSFSDAQVTIITAGSKSWTESFAGGICGTNSGYLADCGNTGSITGISLAGGVTGFTDRGIVTRCYNAGYVKAPAYFSTYLAGGISHMLGRGRIISYCAFEMGTAQVGSSVFNGGTLLGITPLERESFRDLGVLSQVFHVAETAFAYASADSYYPIPQGIFTARAEAPLLPQSGLEVKIEAGSGVIYFYTTDGSDPHAAGVNGVEAVSITLNPDQSIKIFASRPGHIDSQTVEYTAVK